MSQELINGFSSYIKNELGLSQGTLKAYLYDVKQFFDFAEQQELTAKLIEDFISHLRQKGLEATSIRRKSMSIRCLCHHLISLNRLDSNILKMIDSIRVNRRTPDVLDSQAVDKLISSIKNRAPLSRAINVRRDVAIILTLYHSGLRVSELCNLNMNDINFARREILVRGKGSRDRIVPTTQRCIEAIQTYLDFDHQSNTAVVFVKSNNLRMTRRAVSDMLTSLSCRAGVTHTTSHTLRRSCATSLMENGMELELVQALLGHQHLSTTQTYLSISQDRLKAIYAKYHPFGVKNVQRNRNEI